MMSETQKIRLELVEKMWTDDVDLNSGERGHVSE